MSEAIAHEEKKNAAKLAKKLAAKERKQGVTTWQLVEIFASEQLGI